MLYSPAMLMTICIPRVQGVLGMNGILRWFMYRGYTRGYSPEKVKSRSQGSRTIQVSIKGTVPREAQFQKMVGSIDPYAVWCLPGDESEVPVIMFDDFSDNDCLDAWDQIETWTQCYGAVYENNLPSIYAMNYGGLKPASQKTIVSNAKEMIEYVEKKHGRKPHVFGDCGGCAVAIGAIHELGKPVASLTLSDPWSSCLELLKQQMFGWIARWSFGRQQEDHWDNVKCLTSNRELFDQIPTAVFTSTEARNRSWFTILLYRCSFGMIALGPAQNSCIFPQEEHQLRIYSILNGKDVSDGSMFPNSTGIENNLKTTISRAPNSKQKTRMLVQVSTPIYGVMAALRTGYLNPKTAHKCGMCKHNLPGCKIPERPAAWNEKATQLISDFNKYILSGKDASGVTTEPVNRDTTDGAKGDNTIFYVCIGGVVLLLVGLYVYFFVLAKEAEGDESPDLEAVAEL